MNFLKRSFEITELGYIDLMISYRDYSLVSDRISSSRIISSSRTTAPLGGDKEDLDIIIPDWIFKLRNDLSDTIDSITGEKRDYLKDLEGNDLIRKLITIDRSVSLWYDTVKTSESSYKTLIMEDEMNPLSIMETLPMCTAIRFTLHMDSEFFYENVWKKLINYGTV